MVKQVEKLILNININKNIGNIIKKKPINKISIA